MGKASASLDRETQEPAPLPANRALSVPRAQWIVTLQSWVDRLTHGWKGGPVAPSAQVDAGQLERLRRELANAQRMLDAVIGGGAR